MTIDISPIVQKLMLHGGVFIYCTFISFLLVLIDLWDGVRTARLVGEKIRSHRLRKTFEKYLFYWAILLAVTLTELIAVFLDWYDVPYATLCATAGIGYVEIKSLFEHAHKRKDSSEKLESLLSKIVEAATEKDAKKLISDLTEVAKEQ